MIGKVTAISDRNFKQEVLESNVPVLVDFWASWCPPCKMVEPTIRKLAQELKGVVKIARINVDQNSINASRYEITGVPTFIIFKKGEENARCVGAQSMQQLLYMVESAGIKIKTFKAKKGGDR